MMKLKLIVVALAATALTSGCMAFRGESRGSSSSSGYDNDLGSSEAPDDAPVAEGDVYRLEEAANRAEAAANRAEAAADRAGLQSQRSEAAFHKGMRK